MSQVDRQCPRMQMMSSFLASPQREVNKTNEKNSSSKKVSQLKLEMDIERFWLMQRACVQVCMDGWIKWMEGWLDGCMDRWIS